MTSEHRADLLHGTANIAEHLSLKVRQVQFLCTNDDFPTFKIGGKVCALRSKLDAWLLAKSDEASKPLDGLAGE